MLYNYIMKKDNILKLKNENGEIKEYEILLVFKHDNKNYIVYTDDSSKEVIDIYANTFDPNDLSVFNEIESDEEWNLIDNMLKELGDQDE